MATSPFDQPFSLQPFSHSSSNSPSNSHSRAHSHSIDIALSNISSSDQPSPDQLSLPPPNHYKPIPPISSSPHTHHFHSPNLSSSAPHTFAQQYPLPQSRPHQDILHHKLTHQRESSNQASLHSFEQPSSSQLSAASSLRKLNRSNGRPKVNTLPPWAKGHDDDDMLFESLPSSQSGLTSPPYSALPTPLKSPVNHQTLCHSQTTREPSRSLSTVTLVSDTHSLDDRLGLAGFSTATQKRMSAHLGEGPSSETVLPGGRSAQKQPAGPARRSLYRAVTAPSPVFQRLRPLITSSARRRTADDEEGAEPSEAGSGVRRHQPDDRWWQFTLPTKYRRKVEEYIARSGHGQGIGGMMLDGSSEARGSPPNTARRLEMAEIDADKRKIMELLKGHGTSRARLGERDEHGPDAEDGGHGDFPLSAFSRKMSVTYAQQHHQLLDPSDPTSDRRLHVTSVPADPSRSNAGALGSYLIHHPLAPLVCRLLNFMLTSISLALCAMVLKIEKQSGGKLEVGNSTLFILIVGPFGLVHNLFAIYCEYFGAPIGIWSVSWKMFHTLSELLFVSFWSSGLALALNDELSGQLSCGRGGGRFGGGVFEGGGGGGGGGRVDEGKRLEACRVQGSLVAMIFLGLVFYMVVLVVSLFRIFVKVSRKY